MPGKISCVFRHRSIFSLNGREQGMCKHPKFLCIRTIERIWVAVHEEIEHNNGNNREHNKDLRKQYLEQSEGA